METQESGAIAQAAQKLLAVLGEALEDDKQFFRYLVKTKAGAEGDLEERVFRKLDTKQLKEVVGVLKDLKALAQEEGGEENTLRVIFEAGEEEWNE